MRRTKKAEATRDKVRAYRTRMRARGMKPVQIWVPDVDSPVFAREARRQSLAANRSPHAKEDQAFIDAISEW